MGDLHKEWTEAGVSASGAALTSVQSLVRSFSHEIFFVSFRNQVPRLKEDILEHLMLPTAGKIHGDANFLLQQDLTPAHDAKTTKWFAHHVIAVLE